MKKIQNFWQRLLFNIYMMQYINAKKAYTLLFTSAGRDYREENQNNISSLCELFVAACITWKDGELLWSNLDLDRFHKVIKQEEWPLADRLLKKMIKEILMAVLTKQQLTDAENGKTNVTSRSLANFLGFDQPQAQAA